MQKEGKGRVRMIRTQRMGRRYDRVYDADNQGRIVNDKKIKIVKHYDEFVTGHRRSG